MHGRCVPTRRDFSRARLVARQVRPGRTDSGHRSGANRGVSSPFDAPFGATPLQGGYGALGQSSPVNGGRQPPGSQPNDGRASPASGDIVISRECLQQQTASSREWQARCENVADAQGMCATYRGLAKCMEDGIRRVRNLPCPREMLDSSIAAMQDVIDQAKANARQVCAN